LKKIIKLWLLQSEGNHFQHIFKTWRETAIKGSTEIKRVDTDSRQIVTAASAALHAALQTVCEVTSDTSRIQ